VAVVAAASIPAATPTEQSEMDALLDKITLKGISSLTVRERSRLDTIRKNLLLKQQSRQI
jgi:hypothetical protein